MDSLLRTMLKFVEFYLCIFISGNFGRTYFFVVVVVVVEIRDCNTHV